MKVCLNSHCSSEYLEKADEIKISYKDRNKIIDYVEKYPKVTIVLSLRDASEDTEITWEDIKRYQTLCKEQFLFAATDSFQVKECHHRGINYYLDRPINNYEDIYWLKKLKSKYILIEAPLFFDLKNVKDLTKGICSLRLAPNVAYYAENIPKENGIVGSWIRPEDIDLYEELIDTIEFENCDTRKEEALYRIYRDDKKWPTDLNILITNLNYPIDNKYLPDSFGDMRLKCQQKCFKVSYCNFCNRAAVLSTNKDFQKRLNEMEKYDD